MILKLYTFTTFLASPFIVLYLLWRRRKGKEDPLRFQERFGKASLPRPEGMLVWIHAASVGESLAILPLIQRMAEPFPHVKIVLTTGTVTSAKLMETRLPTHAFHQYIPVDSVLAVRRFLTHWKPDLALFVESEFWPNLLALTAKQCPVLLLNARISDRSFAKWQRYPVLSKSLLGYFSLCMPQSNQDKVRLQALGAKNIRFIGNLKYDAPALPANAEHLKALSDMTQNRHVWAAASTHPGEEIMIAEAHAMIKQYYPDVLTIIIPRHAWRGKDLAVQLGEEMHCNIALRSAGQPVTSETDIYLADTMGELGIFYRIANIIYIGGSLVPHGGQNPLEAARLHCAIIAGPHMENFRDIMHEFTEKYAILQVDSAVLLAETVDTLFSDNKKQENLAAASFSIAEAKGEILDGYVAQLRPFIEALNSNAVRT